MEAYFIAAVGNAFILSGVCDIFGFYFKRWWDFLILIRERKFRSIRFLKKKVQFLN